ncbi:sensor histidine kinase [Phenylobacterium sp.]|uniref:sensor histidine kinase n=1 Tax=Phenylobacterium sp. TaxID=1871053 RepID=UPI003BA9FDAD
MATDSNLTDAPPVPRRRAWTGDVAGYGASAILVAAANLIAHLAADQLTGANLAMLFLASVLLSAFWFGLGPALLAACAAALSYNFFFLVPRLSFRIERPADLLTFVVFFAVATSTGWLAARVRAQARSAARRARELAALLEASRGLSAAASPDEAARILAQQAGLAAGRAAIVLLPEADALRLAAGPEGLTELADTTRIAARQAWETGAGSADQAGWSLRPLQGLRERVGVIGLRGASPLSPEQEGLLTALLHQGAVALERANLAAAAAEVDALRKADHLRSALLNSISHDFRTPLATVLGASTTLLDYEASLKPGVRRDLLQSIAEAARRLNRYVGDLLDMSRLEGGALTPRRELTDVRAVLASALARLEAGLEGRRITRDFAPQLSPVSADPMLLEQAVLNIIENAAAYSPPGASIELAAHEDMGHVLISIEDQGPGIPPEGLDKVFDRFRRLEQPTDRGRGLGLGLSIAKGFVEAMGGRIAATSPVAEGRGTRILIVLPKPHPTPRALL